MPRTETVILGQDDDAARIAQIIAKAGGSGTPAGRIALQILAPAAPEIRYNLERINDGSAGHVTAISRTTSEISSNWQLPYGGTGNAYHAVILKRQFGRMAIVNDSNPNNQPFVYTWLGAPSLAQSSWIATPGTTEINPVGSTAVGVIANQSSYQPHGATLSSGYVDGVGNYQWVDALAGTSSINILSSGGNLPATLTAVLYQASDDEEYPTIGGTYTASGSTTYINIPVGASGYYRLKLYNSTTTSVTGLTVFTACGPALGTGVAPVAAQTVCNNLWLHISTPALYNDLNQMSSLRAIGFSAQLLNTQADLFQNGQIASCTVGDGEDWQQVLTSGTNLCNQNMYNLITTYQGNKVKKANTGWFAPVKPNDIEDFAFRNEIQKNAAATSAVVQFPLLDRSPYVAMIITVETSTQLGNPTTSVILRSCFEYYSTTNQLPEMETCKSSIEDLQAAIATAGAAPDFYDNPGHLATIADFVGRILPSVGVGLAAAYNTYQGVAESGVGNALTRFGALGGQKLVDWAASQNNGGNGGAASQIATGGRAPKRAKNY